MTKDEKHTFCRIVGTLVVSDLKLKDTELIYMQQLYEDLGIDEDEQKAIQASINLRDDVKALAAMLSDEARRELLDTLREAAGIDGEVAATEAAIIAKVEEVVG